MSHFVATGAASRTRPARLALHAAVGLAGWGLFIALALWQARLHAPDGWWRDVAALAGLGLVLSVAARGWIAWNRGIYRRRHRRTTPLVIPVAFTEDIVGRPIQAPPGTRRHTGEIVVSVDELTGAKCYRPVHPGASELVAAMRRMPQPV